MTLSFDNKLINGFLKHDSRILMKIYDECYPMVEKMVLNSGGCSVQAQDVFQEAMIVAYRRVLSGKFELSCKFSTYIYAVSKRIWIQEKRKKINKSLRIDETADMVEEGNFYDSFDQQVGQIIAKHFSQLSKDCQKILKMHFNKFNISEIQREMGYDSSHYAI